MFFICNLLFFNICNDYRYSVNTDEAKRSSLGDHESFVLSRAMSDVLLQSL